MAPQPRVARDWGNPFRQTDVAVAAHLKGVAQFDHHRAAGAGKFATGHKGKPGLTTIWAGGFDRANPVRIRGHICPAHVAQVRACRMTQCVKSCWEGQREITAGLTP